MPPVHTPFFSLTAFGKRQMPSSDCVCKGTAFSAFRNGLSQTMKGFCPRPCDARRRKQPEKTEPCRSVGQHYSHEKDSRIHVSRDVANVASRGTLCKVGRYVRTAPWQLLPCYHVNSRFFHLSSLGGTPSPICYLLSWL